MVFDSGYIFKFPAIKSNWAQQDYIVDNDELICPNRELNQYFNPIKESIIYDPRCRHFYYISLNSSYFISEFKSHIENNDTITTRKYSLNYFLIHLINILKNIKV